MEECEVEAVEHEEPEAPDVPIVYVNNKTPIKRLAARKRRSNPSTIEQQPLSPLLTMALAVALVVSPPSQCLPRRVRQEGDVERLSLRHRHGHNLLLFSYFFHLYTLLKATAICSRMQDVANRDRDRNVNKLQE